MAGMRAVFLFVVSVLVSVSVITPAMAAPDPLPSWKDSVQKKAIIGYVNSVTKSGTAQYLRPEDRIAVFDNDGTLWPEQPVAEVAFTLDRAAAMMARDANLKTTAPYNALLEKGSLALTSMAPKDLQKLFLDTHSGMTEDDFATLVREFFYSAKHPAYGVPYARTVYQPMQELIAFLRANGFSIFLCSNGNASFLRVFAEDLYGIPPENVIGTHLAMAVEQNGGRLRLVREPKIESFNDGEARIAAVARHIGKRPVLVAGTISNDSSLYLARYSSEGLKPSLQIMIRHDDAARESAYGGAEAKASQDWAKTYGWQIISMKNDWKHVFSSPLK